MNVNYRLLQKGVKMDKKTENKLRKEWHNDWVEAVLFVEIILERLNLPQQLTKKI